ncbi:Transposase IS204/IS1001/IS1096/IS1165 DDE domain-containing protein [Propionibacterium acidifaciens]
MLTEVTALARRRADILVCFERLGTSNGPTEAVNGRLEHLRGIALELRNLIQDTTCSLLKASRFKPRLHPQM